MPILLDISPHLWYTIDSETDQTKQMKVEDLKMLMNRVDKTGLVAIEKIIKESVKTCSLNEDGSYTISGQYHGDGEYTIEGKSGKSHTVYYNSITEKWEE